MHSCRSGNVLIVRGMFFGLGEAPHHKIQPLKPRPVRDAGRARAEPEPVPAALSDSPHVSMCAMANDNSTGSADATEAVATALYAYYTPLLVLLGFIGNLLSIYVFYVTKLRLQSTSLYLSVLAISDTIFLLSLLPPWLNAMQITNLFHRRGFCQVFVYSSYTSCCLSAWLVVAFTVERFVAVLYPLRRNSMCTTARAKLVILMLVTSSVLVNLPLIIFASSSKDDCNIDVDYMEHAARFNLADTLVSFSLPLGIIVILNAWIIVGVYRLECERRALQAEQAACLPELGCALAPRILPPLRSQHRVTRMLLIVSSVFVILNLPAYTMRLLAYAYNMSTGDYTGRWAALQQLALTFFNTNFGINFILYCLSGQNFRRELCQSIPWLRDRARRCDEMRLNSRNPPSSATSGAVCSVQPTTGRRRFSYAANKASNVSATEASSSAEVESVVATSHPWRHRSEPFIERWTFDNSRVQRPPNQPVEEIEMQDLSRTAPEPDPTISHQDDQPEWNRVPRRIPFVLFPLTNILIPRSKRTVIDTSMYR